jgi:hypothetical protein
MCGRIRYEATGEAVVTGVCYCRECQYVSGGGPAYAIVMLKADVKVTPAMPRAWWSVSDRGNRVARYFCEECGTPLFAENASIPTFVSIKPGSLDDPTLFKPSGSIWVKSAQPWHYIDPNLPRFDKDPA